MKIKHIFLFASALFAVASCAFPQEGYVSFSGYAQGGTYTVKYNVKGVDVPAEQVKDSVDAILAEIDRSLSGYNKKSILSRFNAGKTVAADRHFVEIYNAAYEIFNQTEGVVDVASAPLFDLWGFGFKSGDLPDEAQVLKALSVSGMKRLRTTMPEVDSLDASMLLNQDESGSVQLNYNAIAQGYSCDKVAEYLYSIGVEDMMVDIGEIYCDGKNPSGQQWRLGIDSPKDGNNESGADVQAIFNVPAGPHGVVTSGNYRKFKVVDGKKYAHTIDPRTGYPVMHNLLSATVIASDAMTADAYATYCMAIGLQASIDFISSREDLQACLIYDENGEFRLWCSEGLILDSHSSR